MRLGRQTVAKILTERRTCAIGNVVPPILAEERRSWRGGLRLVLACAVGRARGISGGRRNASSPRCQVERSKPRATEHPSSVRSTEVLFLLVRRAVRRREIADPRPLGPPAADATGPSRTPHPRWHGTTSLFAALDVQWPGRRRDAPSVGGVPQVPRSRREGAVGPRRRTTTAAPLMSVVRYDRGSTSTSPRPTGPG